MVRDERLWCDLKTDECVCVLELLSKTLVRIYPAAHISAKNASNVSPDVNTAAADM